MLVFVIGIGNELFSHQLIEALKEATKEEVLCVNVAWAYSPVGRKGSIHQLNATRKDIQDYVIENIGESSYGIAIPWWLDESPSFLALFSATVAHVTKEVPKIILLGKDTEEYKVDMIR